MSDFIFLQQKQKDNRIPLPISYDREEDTIPGIYTTSSIRFYKKRIDEIINREFFKDNTDLSPTQIRLFLTYFNSAMANFDIEGNRIYLKGQGTVQEREYNFKPGIIIVKNDSFMDAVPKIQLGDYLENYGFDESMEEEILNSPRTVLARIPGKKLTFGLKH